MCSLISLVAPTPHVHAGVVEIFADLNTGRYVDGFNLSGKRLTAGLNANWSAENGTFANVACFTSEKASQTPAIQKGCNANLGYFAVVNQHNAVSFSVARFDYSSPRLQGWQYSNFSINWHFGNSVMFKLRGSNSLLGRGFASATASFQTSQAITERWRLRASAGVTQLEKSAPVQDLKYGSLGAEYNHGRWAAELRIILASTSHQRFVKLKLDQPAFNFNVRYRLF